MNLSRKLARLETIVRAETETPVSPYWTPARIEGYRAWAERLLDTMPPDRARRAFDELTTLPAERWGPVTRRLHHMACTGADGRYDVVTWPYWADRAIALPEAVCELLERYPDAEYVWDYSCER